MSADCVRLPRWHTKKSFHQSWGKYSWCKDTQPHTIYMVSRQMVAWQHHSDPGLGLSTVVQPPCTQSLLKFTRQQKLIRKPLSWLLQTALLFFPTGQSAFSCLHLHVSVIIWLRQEVSEWFGEIRDAGRPHPSPTSHINTYRAHTCSSMKMVCGNSPATFCCVI